MFQTPVGNVRLQAVLLQIDEHLAVTGYTIQVGAFVGGALDADKINTWHIWNSGPDPTSDVFVCRDRLNVIQVAIVQLGHGRL